MIDKKMSILIPDGESPVLMIVLNCFSEKKDVHIHVMSNIKDIPMKHSRNVHKFSFYPKSDSDIDFIKNINDEVEKNKIDLIMPIFEDSTKIILKHKSLISSLEKLVLLPSFENFKTANNKGALNKHLEKNNFPFPKSQIIKKGIDFDINTIEYPILVKPTEGIGGGVGIYVFKNKNELLEFLNSDKFDCIYLLQDYVEGYDIDCSVLCNNGEVLTYTIQKPYLLSSSKFAPQLAVEFIEEDLLLNGVKKIMKTLNWSGVAHLDMRYDENNKEFKVIEINPRYWGSLEASLFAGINFPYLHCVASLNRDFDKPKYRLIKFMLLKGLVKTIKNDKSYLLKLSFMLKNTPLKYMLKDPKPTLYRFSKFFMRKINS
ncbi:MAG: ATP-grasp domain-containing protein [Algibacter sp.]